MILAAALVGVLSLPGVASVSCNQPPVCETNPSYKVECTYDSTGTVSLDGSGASDPDGDVLQYFWTTNCLDGLFDDATSTFPTLTLDAGTVASCKVDLTVTDGSESTSCDSVVTIEDTLPPSVTTSDEDIELWPPNHKYITIDPTQCIEGVEDACEGAMSVQDSAVVYSVSSDEPEDVKGNGDGKTSDDMVIINEIVKLRKERQGKGNGRVYTITYMFKDSSSNSVPSSSCHIGVPHSQNGDPPIDDGAGAGYTIFE